jgi:hypothetical protein
MKTNKIVLVALLFISLSTSASSESAIITTGNQQSLIGNFGRFMGHRQQQGTALSWTMLSNESIVGFVVERSYDGIYFDEIGELSSNSNNRYRYQDSFVFPGFIHYRITAIYANGTTEVSETIIVHIVSKK